MPRWPVCTWRPHARLPEGVGIPVGAFVTSRPEAVQRVRQALMDTGRLKAMVDGRSFAAPPAHPAPLPGLPGLPDLVVDELAAETPRPPAAGEA